MQTLVFPRSSWGSPEGIQSWGGGSNAFDYSNYRQAPDRRPPGPPRDVLVTVVGDFTIRVTFRDFGTKRGSGIGIQHPVFVQTWEIRACPVNLAGSQSGDAQWKRSVLEKSHAIGSIQASNMGEMLSLSITDDTLGGSYIQVVGYSVDTYTRGQPSEPILVFSGGALPSGPLNDVTRPQVLSVTSFLDGYGDHFVDIATQYLAPTTIGRFFGLSLMIQGYLGSTGLAQAGDLLLLEGIRGGTKQKNTVRIASDKDFWGGGYASVGTVHAINGSPTVTLVSGPNFDTGGTWNNKTAWLVGASPPTYTVSVVGAVNSMTLTGNFTGLTGDFPMLVLNPVTFYFVSVDRSGDRRSDPLGAPSVARAVGIFAS